MTSPDTERAFLDQYDPAQFDRPSVAVDVVLLTALEGRLHALLVQRAEHPFRGHWALPGGFVTIDQSLDAAARQVLTRKTGLEGVYLEQLYTFGAPGRDPRMRIVSVAYYALVPSRRLAELAEHLHPIDVPWEGERGGPAHALGPDALPVPLAFDHADILGMAVLRIRGKLGYTHIGFELLPELFTLRQLRAVHETILGRSLNKDSFRRRALASGVVEATGRRQSDTPHRPAELFRFTRPEPPRR